MSKETNRKILLGSLTSALDKRLIVGDTFDKQYLSTVLLLVDRIDYCILQYEKGVTDYVTHVKSLTDSLNKLKYKCPSVCIYKDRLIIRGDINTAPTISNNTITIPFSTEEELLQFNEVVYNFIDSENDYISEIIFLNEDPKHDILINNADVIINNNYNLPINIGVKYKIPEGDKILIKNLNTDPCTAELITLSESDYLQYVDNQIIEINSLTDKTVFQKITTSVEELPNDSIIYAHIDSTSLTVNDQNTITESVSEWYTQFRIDNPTFNGSLVVNLLNNFDIADPRAVGRDFNGMAVIEGFPLINTGGGKTYQTMQVDLAGLSALPEANLLNGDNCYVQSEFDYYYYDVDATSGAIAPDDQTGGTGFWRKSIMVESWLQTPTFGLLRQAWKEGYDTFTEEEFYAYIKNKSLIVLSFIDEASPAYHTETTIPTTNQPTSTYISDYNNFTEKVRANLKLFKGVLYPVTRPQNNNRVFLTHAISAIEARPLTLEESQTIIGQEKLSTLSFRDTITDTLATSPSPYANYDKLKQLGWSGDFTKTGSNTSDSFTSEELALVLDDFLTNVEDIEVKIIEKIEVDSASLGESISTQFVLKVRDNNISPLESNEATITINHEAVCESVPICSGLTESKNIGSTDGYIFLWEDFTTDINVDKIKVTNISIPRGTLLYYDIAISTLDLPLVFTKIDVTSGNVKYIPVQGSTEEYNVAITYKLSYIGSINYCVSTEVLQVNKNEVTNQPAIVQTTDLTVEIPYGETVSSATIPTNIFYTGSGSYQISWEQISGPNEASLTDSTVEDLEVTNLIAGQYIFQITVTTDVDGFETIATSIIDVQSDIETILFGGNLTELLNTSLDAEVEVVLDALQQNISINSNPFDITCTDDNDTANDWGNFTYIAFKDALGTITSIIQSNFFANIIDAFEDLGTFTYDGNSWRVLKSNSPGAFADQTVLTITYV